MASNSIGEQCKEQPLAQPVMQIVTLTHFLTLVQTTLEQVQAILPKSSDPTPFRLPAGVAPERLDEVHTSIRTTLETVRLVRQGTSCALLPGSKVVREEGIAD